MKFLEKNNTIWDNILIYFANWYTFNWMEKRWKEWVGWSPEKDRLSPWNRKWLNSTAQVVQSKPRSGTKWSFFKFLFFFRQEELRVSLANGLLVFSLKFLGPSAAPMLHTPARPYPYHGEAISISPVMFSIQQSTHAVSRYRRARFQIFQYVLVFVWDWYCSRYQLSIFRGVRPRLSYSSPELGRTAFEFLFFVFRNIAPCRAKERHLRVRHTAFMFQTYEYFFSLFST